VKSNLEGGSSLEVEDLDVFLEHVTFIIPRSVTSKYVERIKKNLIKRKINFEANELFTNCHNFWYADRRGVILKVGDYSFHFSVSL